MAGQSAKRVFSVTAGTTAFLSLPLWGGWLAEGRPAHSEWFP